MYFHEDEIKEVCPMALTEEECEKIMKAFSKIGVSAEEFAKQLKVAIRKLVEEMNNTNT